MEITKESLARHHWVITLNNLKHLLFYQGFIPDTKKAMNQLLQHCNHDAMFAQVDFAPTMNGIYDNREIQALCAFFNELNGKIIGINEVNKSLKIRAVHPFFFHWVYQHKKNPIERFDNLTVQLASR